jgi:hypothetical protein
VVIVGPVLAAFARRNTIGGDLIPENWIALS